MILESESLYVLKWHSTFYFVLFFSFIAISVGRILPLHKICTVGCKRISSNKKQFTTQQMHTFIEAYFLLAFFLFIFFFYFSFGQSHFSCVQSTSFTLSMHKHTYTIYAIQCKMLIRFSCYGDENGDDDKMRWLLVCCHFLYAIFFLVKDKFIANSQTSINVIIIYTLMKLGEEKTKRTHCNNNNNNAAAVSKQRDRSATSKMERKIRREQKM